MSENSRSTPSAADPRAQRSRDRLGDALVALIQERPFDEITVQDVLERAGVSRSTFYAHFRDKQDLLLSDVDDFAERMFMRLARSNDPSERVAPVVELFAHVAEMAPLRKALSDADRLLEIRSLIQAHVARGIEARLTQISRAKSLDPATRAPLAHAAAGGLMALLEWWLRTTPAPTPAEMDELFHRQFWSGATSRGAGPIL